MARSDCEPCSRSASPAGSNNCSRGLTRGTRVKETAIVVGLGRQNFNIRMGSSKEINLVFKGLHGGGGICISSCDDRGGSCVTRTKQGGFQISSSGRSLEIALDANGSVVSLGSDSPSGCAAKLYGCDSKASFNPRGGGATVAAGGKSLQLCLGGGKLQLNISSKGKGGSQVTCGGGNEGIEVTYGPLKKKIDLGHCKPTITHLIHRRMTELGKQMRLAECTYASLHPCPPPFIKIT